MVTINPGWGRGPTPGPGLPLPLGAPGLLLAAFGSPEPWRDLGGGCTATNTNFISPRGVGGLDGIDHPVLRHPPPQPVRDPLVDSGN